MITETRTFSTREVADMVGATYRKMDWLIRRELIDPSSASGTTGSGVYRRWTAEQVPVVMLIRALFDLGLPHDRVAEGVEMAGPIETWRDREMQIYSTPGAGYWVDLGFLLSVSEKRTGVTL